LTCRCLSLSVHGNFTLRGENAKGGKGQKKKKKKKEKKKKTRKEEKDDDGVQTRE
jgi:ribosomal protein L12E/L44/L45/RPP1/RPP2